jgi:hypothetical protein
MSNYTPSTNFATKDALPSGDPLKIVKGTEINTEFVNIQTAIATKADLASPTFTGNVTGTFVGNVTGNVTGNVSGTAANVTGTVAVANGGTGATSFTSGALLKGAGTGAVAAASAADIVAQIGSTAVANATTAANGGVTSVNGSTGAVTIAAVPSSISAIGSVVMAAHASTGNLLPGDTIAGSSLYYPSTITLVATQIFTEGPGGGFAGVPQTGVFPGAGAYPFGGSQKLSSGNTGYVVPSGHTALSGTWRVLSVARSRSSIYDSGYNYTTSTSPCIMAVRIS